MRVLIVMVPLFGFGAVMFVAGYFYVRIGTPGDDNNPAWVRRDVIRACIGAAGMSLAAGSVAYLVWSLL